MHKPKPNLIIITILAGLLAVLCLTGCLPTADEKEASSIKNKSLEPLPSLKISAASTAKVNQFGAVEFNIEYANAADVRLSSDQITLLTNGTADCQVTVASIIHPTATVMLHHCTGDGSVYFEVVSGSANNAAGTSFSTASPTFVVDNTGISTGTFSLPAGSYSVIPNEIKISLPEHINAATVSNNDILISGTCSGLFTNGTYASGASITIILSDMSGCFVGQTVTVTTNLNGIEDSSRNAGQGSVSVTYTISDSGPIFAAFSPVSKAVSAEFSKFTFTIPGYIDSSTLTAEDFILSGTCNQVSVQSASISGSVATVFLSGVALCIHQDTVIVSVDLTGVNDAAGLAGIGSFSETYTVDKVLPDLTFELHSEVRSSVPTEITVALSSDVDPSTVVVNSFSLLGTCSGIRVSEVAIFGAVATVAIVGGENCVDGNTVEMIAHLITIKDLVGNRGSGFSSLIITLDVNSP